MSETLGGDRGASGRDGSGPGGLFAALVEMLGRDRGDDTSGRDGSGPSGPGGLFAALIEMFGGDQPDNTGGGDESRSPGVAVRNTPSGGGTPTFGDDSDHAPSDSGTPSFGGNPGRRPSGGGNETSALPADDALVFRFSSEHSDFAPAFAEFDGDFRGAGDQVAGDSDISAYDIVHVDFGLANLMDYDFL
jgi:hypothetical protein